ncbi:hypothetical protein lbkm_2290 [Lachnospiraceae bacterium KM106-2]|nr:hypothetical protein lbkm_2290 [Lachnospiraceae bacterium KM106-2]
MKKKHLPLYGVGPFYGVVIIGLTVLAIWLVEARTLMSGQVGEISILFRIVGGVFILFGVGLWVAAAIGAKIDKNIKENKLVTTGIYAYVRNPLYSAFLFACTGSLLCATNTWLLVLPVVYWCGLTVLMKCTEEKWLTKLYGEEYVQYCKRVNRCIPWIN